MHLVFLYYDNPDMLREQIRCWNFYPDILRKLPQVFLIDDGSPKTFAADIVQECRCRLPVKVFRVQEDIPWNFAGARNLGCSQAEGWIYVSDIDTLLPAQDARRFFEDRPLDKDTFYMPKRIYLPGMEVARPAFVNLLFHKQQYVATGGYDEDYAGHYGKEEIDFFSRISCIAALIKREDVVVRVMSPNIIADARTRGRSRNSVRNAELFEKKKGAGFINPGNPLRFSWKRVL